MNLKKGIMLIGLFLIIAVFSAAALDNWATEREYLEGDEVIYQGTIYQAKWWNYNEAPKGEDWDVWAEVGPAYDYSDNVAPSQNPPAGLTADEVPQFVVFGFDDNYSPAAVEWLINFLAAKNNNEGNGSTATYDGETPKVTFYHTGIAMWGEMQHAMWKKAEDAGHETANHTLSHGDGAAYTLEQWNAEIKGQTDKLIAALPDGMGSADSKIMGLRGPYLNYNSDTFRALKEQNMIYDATIQEGFHWAEDGRNFYWPYTLDNGSPGHDTLVMYGVRQPIDNAPGVWEVPIYALIAPPDDKCVEYGIEPGLRAKCATQIPWFDTASGKITGFDYNLIHEYAMTPDEFLATLKYTFDLRLEGNKAPFTFGGHSHFYDDPGYKAALGAFIDYVLTKPEVRIVTPLQLIEWMRNPAALQK